MVIGKWDIASPMPMTISFFATDTKKGKTEKNLPKAMAVK